MSKITIYNRSDGKEIPAKPPAMTQRFIPAKCIKTKEGLLIKLVRDEKGWCWDSTFKDGAAQGTSHSHRTDDIVFDAPQRTGDGFCCAGCGTKHVVKCNSCKQISCWSGSGLFACAFCGNTGEVTGTITSVNAVAEGKKK